MYSIRLGDRILSSLGCTPYKYIAATVAQLVRVFFPHAEGWVFKSRFRQNRSTNLLGNRFACHGVSEMIGDGHKNGYPVWRSMWHHKFRVGVKSALHRITEWDDKPQATDKHPGIMFIFNLERNKKHNTPWGS